MTDLSRGNSRDGDFYRSLGGLEASLESHEKRLDAIEGKLDKVLEVVSASKGGWRMLMTIAGISAIAGGMSERVFSILKSLWE